MLNARLADRRAIGPENDEMMMGYGLGYGAGAAGLLWGIGGILLLVGLVILVVWAVSRVAPGSGAPMAPASDPLALLRERFARGEITEAEFTQAKRVLGYER